MMRTVVVPGLFVAIGVAAASLVISRRAPSPPAPAERISAPTRADRVPAGGAEGGAGTQWADIERRLKRLEASVADAAAARRRLEEQLAQVTTQLAARDGGRRHPAPAAVTGSSTAAAPADDAAPAAAGTTGKASALERGLVAAGLDPPTVADIKHRHDESTMAEIYLRDQATREQWLDTPRFTAEMAAIEAQRTPLRDEIGDAAYDRYLFALGEANRVRVEDVLQESPAAQAGLQPGDLILRYGDTRIFAPNELVNATRGGTAGENVAVEILRDGQPLEVQVPRGPLGVSIAGTQANPGGS